MKQKVDSKRKVMHVRMSDLGFLTRNMRVVKRWYNR